LIPGQDIALPDITGVDKIGHIGMFLVLGWLWLRAPGGYARPDASGPLVVAAVILAVGTEIMQHYLVPGRFGDPYDAIADVLGVALAVGLHSWLRRRPRADFS
jgi:VanZ family protein